MAREWPAILTALNSTYAALGAVWKAVLKDTVAGEIARTDQPSPALRSTGVSGIAHAPRSPACPVASGIGSARCTNSACSCTARASAAIPVSADAASGVTLRIIAALPTPELRTGAFLAVLTRTVTARCGPFPPSRPDGDLHEL
jgi:hypothetical protein